MRRFDRSVMALVTVEDDEASELSAKEQDSRFCRGTGGPHLRVFLEHVVRAPLSGESEELFGAAVYAADQTGPLVLPRDLVRRG